MEKIRQADLFKIEEAMQGIAQLLKKDTEINIQDLSKKAEERFYDIPSLNDDSIKIMNCSKRIIDIKHKTSDLLNDLDKFAQNVDIIPEDWA